MASFPPKPCLIFLLLPLLFLSSYSSLALASANAVDEDPFTYSEGSGKGPNHWGSINSTWKTCGTGKLQSPINLTDNGLQMFPLLGKLKTNYKSAPAVLQNKGHDIQVKWLADAGQMNINGTLYNLIQIHWHTPSEHTINGQRFDMELHAVHKNGKEEPAVIGVLYKYGQPDPFLSKLLPKIKSMGKGDADLGIVDPKDMRIESTGYYRYMGSLTTPPCNEGVIWTIVKKVKTVSMEQVQALKGAVHHGFEVNARPCQQLDGRPVWFYGGPA